MRDEYDDKEQDGEEDNLDFGKVKKVAVLDPEDEDDNVISGDDADFALADNLPYEEEVEGGFALYDGGAEEDDLSLQF